MPTAGNLDRIYEEASPHSIRGFDSNLLEHGFFAGHGDHCISVTRVQLHALLSDARASERLINDMAKPIRSREDAVTYVEHLLNQFHDGFASQVAYEQRPIREASYSSHGLPSPHHCLYIPGGTVSVYPLRQESGLLTS